MGRPPLRKKGAYTAAERQRRRRKRLAAEKRAAETEEKRAASHRAYLASRAAPREPRVVAEVESLALPDAADEIALQIAEVVQVGDLTIDDIRAAIDRRFGAPRCSPPEK
jgi:hypothetical protein